MASKIVFRPILPKNPQMFADLETELLGEIAATMMGPIAKTLVKAEENYIDNWEHRPKIVSEFTRQKTQMKLVVKPSGTNKRYWVFVSMGTQGKQINPIRGPLLWLKGKYTPKTRPNNQWGGSGIYESGRTPKDSVDWPGIKPRHFEENIVRTYSVTTIAALSFAINKVFARNR